jgi:hypothetical protein
MQVSNIILIQSMVRGFIVRRSMTGITCSKFQTKQWRNSQYWFVGGRKNECEKHQIRVIEKITGEKLVKTNERINLKNSCIVGKSTIAGEDGFELTENFDGKVSGGNATYYFNLKFVCGAGGAQTRTLREVYHFIKSQLQTMLVAGMTNCYFINILDGDESFKQREKFAYLVQSPEFEQVKKYLFCGDANEFKKWWRLHRLHKDASCCGGNTI